MDLHADGVFTHGHKTETAGTAIVIMVPGMKGRYTHVKRITYTTGATLHTITVMRKVAETTLSAAAAAAQAVIALTADPGSIAANDNLAIQKPNGSWHFGVVSSVSSLNITLTANVPTGGFSSGARVIFYGVVGDADHDNHDYRVQANATNAQIPDDNDGVVDSSTGVDEPVILSSDNGTNAGRFELVEAVYSRVPAVRAPS